MIAGLDNVFGKMLNNLTAGWTVLKSIYAILRGFISGITLTAFPKLALIAGAALFLHRSVVVGLNSVMGRIGDVVDKGNAVELNGAASQHFTGLFLESFEYLAYFLPVNYMFSGAMVLFDLLVVGTLYRALKSLVPHIS